MDHHDEITTTPRFYGKFRGTVKNNIDPLFLGRVQVECPAVLGTGRLSWATPCTPYAGDGVGLFLVPPNGASVWVEFEGGDPDRPILGGCFWEIGQVPASPAVPQMKVLKTESIELTLSDMPGIGGVSLKIETPTVAMPIEITATSSGVLIAVGGSKVELSGVSVSINDGALEVT